MLSKRLIGLTCGFALAGCTLGFSAVAASASTMTGSGSTLAAPIIQEWGAAWGTSTGNTVTYSAVGSGTSYKNIANGLTDFGASDAPLSTFSSPPCNNCVQIPWGISAVGVTFNIPGVHRLRLTPDILADIYLGKITNWNNSRIKHINPGVNLPDLAISVFWRSDGSGTTFAFTKYLSSVSAAFAHAVGSSTTVSWPVGAGAKGSTGMAAAAGQTKGAIAYVEVAYLIADKLPAASIQNRASRYIVPNLNAIEAAARTVHSVPANNELFIVDPPKKAKTAYPISTFTYAIVHTNAPQAGLLRQFLGYCVTQGQAFAPRLDFAPLPTFIRRADLNTIATVTG